MFRADSKNERRTGRAVASAPASARDAVSDIATPGRIRQTTPASLEERARVLRGRRRAGGRLIVVPGERSGPTSLLHP
jgi:hypothetical protein